MPTGTHDRLGEPGINDVRQSLQRVLGDEFEDTWRELCATVEIDEHSVTADDHELTAMLESLIQRGSTCRVIAMSWTIRRTAARKLAELGR